MANKCAICGADINLIQTQKLSDGNCICRKNCHRCGLYPLPHHSGQDESKAENGPFSAGSEQLYESRQHEHHREPRYVPV